MVNAFQAPLRMLARWIEELMSYYDMTIIHRKDQQHTNSDSLQSRIPSTTTSCHCYFAGCDVDKLPCGGCKFCTNLHKQWTRFEDDVDDILPLAVREITVMISELLG